MKFTLILIILVLLACKRTAPTLEPAPDPRTRVIGIVTQRYQQPNGDTSEGASHVTIDGRLAVMRTFNCLAGICSEAPPPLGPATLLCDEDLTECSTP